MQGMDRGSGYNRRLRKMLHILAGLPAFMLPYVPHWGGMLFAIIAAVVAFSLRPKHSWWLRYISKPADRNRNVITGLRGYATVVLVLVAVGWILAIFDPAQSQFYYRYVMLGWLSLALGDGLAGLVGPGPKVTRTVPWNRHKTWWGMIGCYFGVCLAYYLSFALPFGGGMAVSLPVIFSAGPVVAVLIALLESLDLEIDDNFTVGFGAPLAAALLHVLAG
jgi:dolichol kinase